jgi:hypothetical protein
MTSAIGIAVQGATDAARAAAELLLPPSGLYNKNAGIRSQDDRVRGRDRQHAAQELLPPDWIRPEKQSFAHVN